MNSAEKYAYISVAKKQGLEELVTSLAPEYTIITMGGTKTEIESFQIAEAKLILPEDFLGNAALKGYLEHAQSEEERRDLLAVPIGHRMSRPLKDTEKIPLIDWVYIKLGRGIDVGGVFMISAAIRGGRAIMTDPSESTGEVRWRSHPRTTQEHQKRRKEQGYRAKQAISRYFANP